MARKIKTGKILIVVLLTVLIWIWADLAQDETFEVPSIKMSVAKSTSPGLWVRLNGESSISVKDVVLKGSASRIAKMRGRLSEGSLSCELFLDLEREAITGPEYVLDVLNFLKKSHKIKQFGLTVESCQPDTLNVEVDELVEKSLEVRCIDKNENPVRAKMIDPPRVNISVPKDWRRERLVAYVLLTRGEIVQARSSAVEKIPYIELSDGQRREAREAVKITTSPEEGLQEYNIASATIGFVLSPNLVGKYNVELLNQSDMAMVSIKATSAAKSIYQQQPYQMLLYILDGDEKNTGVQKKRVVYNFPEEFVRSEEIELKGQAAEAQFKLIRLASSETPSGGAE